MDFSLPCCASGRLERWLARTLLLCALLLGCALPAARAAQLDELRVDRTVDGLFLYAQLNFQLSPSIDGALRKGIPIYFVASAKVMRKRWYWYDQELSRAERHMRVAYQPLTRQWRLNSFSGVMTEDHLGLGLTRYFDSLADTLGALERIAGWKIATLADLSGGGRQFLQFDFRLDSSQLPRALLLGGIGGSDWHLSIERRIDLSQDGAE